MAGRITFQQAINEALAQEMGATRPSSSSARTSSAAPARPARTTRGAASSASPRASTTSSPDRVLDTPISESAIIGAAAGAAASGLRPVVELMFVDFMGVCLDQIFNQAAKFRYMFGGKAVTPMVVRTMFGAGIRAASQHSQALYPIFTHIPGLKVVVPSTPYDAKGLLIQAIRDDDPVIFLEHKVLYTLEGDVPEEAYAIPFGEADIVREGDDVTVVALGRMVQLASRRRRRWTGSSARSSTRARRRRSTRRRSSRASRTPAGSSSSTRPTRAAGWRRTSSRRSAAGVLRPEGGAGMVTPPHTPVPFSPVLEDAYVPTPDAIAGACARPRGARSGMSDRQARHAQVGPVDDRGPPHRMARRRGRGARRRRRGRRGRDGEDQRRGRVTGGGRLRRRVAAAGDSSPSAACSA